MIEACEDQRLKRKLLGATEGAAGATERGAEKLGAGR